MAWRLSRPKEVPASKSLFLEGLEKDVHYYPSKPVCLDLFKVMVQDSRMPTRLPSAHEGLIQSFHHLTMLWNVSIGGKSPMVQGGCYLTIERQWLKQLWIEVRQYAKMQRMVKHNGSWLWYLECLDNPGQDKIVQSQSQNWSPSHLWFVRGTTQGEVGGGAPPPPTHTH